MIFTVRQNFEGAVAEKLAKRTDAAGHIVAMQVSKDTEPYTPMLTGSLKNRTRVIGNSVIYPGPYARYLYHGKVMVDAATGKGPMRIIDKLGNEYIRFRKGTTLKPTERPLTYTTDFHPRAGAKWFERSKADNLPKWLRVAKRAVTGNRE